MAFISSDPNTSHVLGEQVVITEVQAEQSADFTATAGQNGVCHEWPVDITGVAPGGKLSVAAPASPAVGDCFAVFDSKLAADNGLDSPGLDRNIQIDFASDSLQGQAAPEYAVINAAGARIQFIFAGGSIGWRLSATVNQ